MKCETLNGQCTQGLQYNGNNQIVGYTYDAAGDLTTDGVVGKIAMNTYTYDAEGHVTSISNASGTTTLSYYVDGNAAEVRPAGGQWIYDSGYDPWGVGETFESDTCPPPTCIGAAMDNIPLNGRVIAAYRETAPNQTVYYHYDRLGSMIMVTDQTGQATESLANCPFGVNWVRAAATVIAGSVTAILPVTYVGGVGPTVQFALSGRGWGCPGAGGAVGTLGKAFNMGPITGGALGNIRNVLSGLSASTVAQGPNPFVGTQAIANPAGMAYGPIVSTSGGSVSATYSFCGNIP